ncbi:hypothetical protein BJ165DRAFT_1595273 [Panaeolus papilionaceus]|nr:hypothetical protein BJ165DRAFT_1595273 [Panaeolus papilionaceus]
MEMEINIQIHDNFESCMLSGVPESVFPILRNKCPLIDFNNEVENHLRIVKRLQREIHRSLEKPGKALDRIGSNSDELFSTCACGSSLNLKLRRMSLRPNLNDENYLYIYDRHVMTQYRSNALKVVRLPPTLPKEMSIWEYHSDQFSKERLYDNQFQDH